jgi:hypothetical protein
MEKENELKPIAESKPTPIILMEDLVKPIDILSLKPSLVPPIPDTKQKEKINSVFSLLLKKSIDLFTKNLIFKSELQKLFNDLPETETSFTLALSLIDAFNRLDVKALIKNGEIESFIHAQIANQFLTEIEERAKRYSDIINQKVKGTPAVRVSTAACATFTRKHLVTNDDDQHLLKRLHLKLD